MPLSDVTCRNAKPKAKAYKLSDSGGLYLEVTATGSKLWRLKYRYLGKEKRLALGKYPEVKLSDAREGRDNAKKLLADHKDPSTVKKEAQQSAVANASNTFEALALTWYNKNKAGWSENHATTVMRRLEWDIFPSLGKLPTNDITTSRLAEVIGDIEKRGANETARRALQYCKNIFSYGQILGKVTNNPASFNAREILSPMKRGQFAAMDAKVCLPF